MGSFLEKKIELTFEGYTEYYLGQNPFPTAQMLGGYTSSDKMGAYWQRLFFKEARKITQLLQEMAFEDKPKTILLHKEPNIRTSMINSIFGITLRALLNSKNPRILPLEDSLPLIYKGLLDNFWRNASDYIQFPQYKFCIFAFLYQQLKLLKDGEIQAELGDIDLEALFKEIDETNGQALEDIFVLPEEIEDEEESEVNEEEIDLDKIEDEEMKDFILEVNRLKEERKQREEAAARVNLPEPKTEEDPRREKLLDFFLIQLERSNLGEQGKEVVKTCLEESYLDGFTVFKTKREIRESLQDLMKLITRYYNKVVYMVDHMEGWPALEDNEKAKFIGEMAEFPHFIEGQCILVFLVSDQIFEVVGKENFPSNNELIKLELGRVGQKPDEITEIGQIKEIMEEFLSADAYRQKKLGDMEKDGKAPIYPFTEDGLEELFNKCGRDVLALFPYAYEALEQGKEAGFVEIDKDFVASAKLGPETENT